MRMNKKQTLLSICLTQNTRKSEMLPRMSDVVKTYVVALAKLIDCPIDATLEGMALANAGCLRTPLAELAIIGTSCG